ncbi:MAG: VWA domain-containing protein [Mogibacterium sp.]|nr:VWA domain-containing protein [Mogibacterium sp.]
MRPTPDKMRAFMAQLRKKMNFKSLVVTLAAIVVFTTTYLLILPAFTLDKEEAVEQGGIDVVAVETAADADQAEKDAVPEETAVGADQADKDAVPEETAADADQAEKDVVPEEKAEPKEETGKAKAANKSEAIDKPEAAAAKPEVNLLTQQKTITADQAKGDDFEVSAVVDGGSKVPEDVSITAAELGKKTDEEKEIFAKYEEEALKALKEDSDNVKAIKSIKLYDISLESDSQDESVEPAKPVNVKIAYEDGMKVDNADNIRIVHFAAQENGEEKAVVLDADENKVETTTNANGSKVTEASFDTDGFSTFAVVEVELKTLVITASGETYEISVNYGPNAGIPDGAELYASEITDEETYNTYLEKAAEEVCENGDNSILSARFFDIEIRDGDEVIEPQEPVNVSIKYNESIVLGDEDEMSAIHFGEDGIDVTKVTPEANNDETEVVFEQAGFSVTGTIITSGVISNGDYCILYKNGSNYYALANDGSAVQVSVDENGAVKPVSGEDLATNLIWTRSGRVWRGNQNTGRYLHPAYNSATSTSNANLTITISDDNDGNDVFKFYYNEYYLRFSNGSFTGGSDSNNQFYLARIESDTNVKIHYGYLNDGGNFVEWTEKVETLRNPNMLGDQYDVKLDIEGYEYVTTRLTSATGTDIYHLIQTQQNKIDGTNTPYSPNENTTNISAIWKYRETTSDNAIYPNWSGPAYDYRLDSNALGDKDIYVIYRKELESSSQSEGQDIDDIDAPKISKEKQDNEDGTYDIELSVTGEAASEKHSGRANVVVVLDSSGSMNENAQSGGTKWTLTTRAVKALSTDLLGLNTSSGEDSKRVEFAFVNFSNYVKNENWIYSVGSNNKNQHFYTNPSRFNSMIDSLQVSGGTCWDKAMEAASNVLWDDDDPVYVVFISDGDTNSRAYSLGNYDLWDGGTYVDNTYSTDYEYNANAKLNVDSTINFADKIRANGGVVYTIGITGGGNLANLYRLNHGTAANPINHFDVSDSAGITHAFDSIKSDILSTLGYQDVEVKDGLTGMTSTSLLNGSAENFSYIVAKYDEEKTILQQLPEGAEIGSKRDETTGTITSYSRNTDGTYTKTVKTIVEGTKATVTENANGTLSIRFPDNTTDTVNKAGYTENGKQVAWDFGEGYQLRDGYTYTVAFTVWPNQASYDIIAALRNKLLEWGDPFTYVDEHGHSSVISAAEYQQQIQKAGDSYSLKSNVDEGNTVSYYKVSTQQMRTLPPGASIGTTTDPDTGVITTYTRNSDGTYTKTVKTPGSQDFVNPEPMPLTGSQLSITKNWNDETDASQLEALIKKAEQAGGQFSITLVVHQNGVDYKSYVFTPQWNESTQEYEWKPQDVNIAPALLVSENPGGDTQYKTVTLEGTTYYVLNDGHAYTITEEETENQFEFSADPYHPALVDGVMHNVVFETNTDGSIKNNSEAIIYGEVPLETFEGTNSLKSELDITKVITNVSTDNDKQISKDDPRYTEPFTYRVKLSVPADSDPTGIVGREYVPRLDDPWNGSTRVYIYGYQGETNGTATTFAPDTTRFKERIYGAWNTQVYKYFVRTHTENSQTIVDRDEDGNFIWLEDGDGITAAKKETIDGKDYYTIQLDVTIKMDEVYRFNNLPSGTRYEITEYYWNKYPADNRSHSEAHTIVSDPSNIDESGYSVTVNQVTGAGQTTVVHDKSVSGTINDLDTRYYNQFVNDLKGNPDIIQLQVTKHLLGYEWTGERYYFRLSAVDGAPMPPTLNEQLYVSSTSGTDDKSYAFGYIRFTKKGTYRYKITELDPATAGISAYSAVEGVTGYGAEKTITIVVDDDLKVTSVTGTDTTYQDRLVNTTFTNTKGTLIKLLKIGDASFDKPLNDVKFKLYSDQACETQVTKDSHGNDIGTNGEITTGPDGMADIGKLAAGTYYLKETAGADGYKGPIAPITITVETDGAVSYTQTDYSDSGKGPDLVYQKNEDGSYVYYSKIRGDESDQYKDDSGYTFVGYRIVVNNTSGEELPHTGGIGTTIFYILGSLLVIGCGIMLISRRRAGMSR